MDESNSERSKRYRAYAEEIRSVAMEIKHPESRVALFRLATTYERQAARIESETEIPVDIEEER